MNPTRLVLACLVSSSLLAPTMAAADLFGDSAWDGVRLGVSVGPFSAEPEDGDDDVDILAGSAHVASVSGYGFRNRPALGWFVGGIAEVTYDQSTSDSSFYAIAPKAIAAGGLYWQPGEGYRLEAGPRLGLGLAMSSYRPAPGRDRDESIARPFAVIGFAIDNVVFLQGGRRLVFTIGYTYENQPKLRPQGVIAGFSYAWE